MAMAPAARRRVMRCRPPAEDASIGWRAPGTDARRQHCAPARRKMLTDCRALARQFVQPELPLLAADVAALLVPGPEHDPLRGLPIHLKLVNARAVRVP